jgi:hypothetical protein
MNLQFYVEKLKESNLFKNFMKEHLDAVACSGFFVIDKTGKEVDKQHFDFYLPKENKMMSIQLENMQLAPIEIFNQIPEETSFDYDVDFDKILEMIEKRMIQESMKNKIQKILFSLQRLNGEDFLVGTVFISMLGMLKINIKLKTMEITEFGKKSFFDIIKVSKGKK